MRRRGQQPRCCKSFSTRHDFFPPLRQRACLQTKNPCGIGCARRAFFDRVIAKKGMIAGYHFGFPNVGTLTKDGNGYAFAAVKA